MAKARFTSPVDMSTLNMSGWFAGLPTSTSATSMTFVTAGQTVVLQGSGFDYFFGFPQIGTVSGFSFNGAVSGAFAKLDLTIGAFLGALGSPDPAAAQALLYGGGDKILGSFGDDRLCGFAGRDRIGGGKGADTLVGGAGGDLLAGGAGADRFVYTALTDSTKGRPDLILDLGKADVIDLSALASDAHHVSAVFAAGVTTFSIDLNGDGKADMAIQADGDQTAFDGFVF